jgi:hypothetical protein
MNRYSNIGTLTTPEGKQYKKTVIYPPIPKSITDDYIITVFGDRLDILAELYYNDSSLWWIIMSANIGVIRRDSLFVNVGSQLRIPVDNISGIVQKFEEINTLR